MDGLIALLMGWAFERAHMIMSAPNYDSLYNGFGAIDLVNERRAKAPMAYRVLFPWLVALLEKAGLRRIAAYQGLKVLFNALAFWSVMQAFGLPAALLTAVLLLLTVKFDYWDWMPEMIGVCLALSGSLPLALAGAALAALSRETALVCPVAFLLAGGGWPGFFAVLLVTALVLLAVRAYVGKRELYCERFQIRYNLGLFQHFRNKEFWVWGQWYHQDIFIACALTLLGLASAWGQGWVGLVPLAFLAAGWTLAKADETRVFSAALPFIAAMLVRG